MTGNLRAEEMEEGGGIVMRWQGGRQQQEENWMEREGGSEGE